MSASPHRRLRYEHSGSSNDVDISPQREDQAGLLPSPVSRPDRAGQTVLKRAYRQRRKDPSCDACRERKVRCDASDAGACSECYTRGVQCTFAKENNRRMSSLRQIQELEDRLTKSKQEVVQLRMLLHKHKVVADDADLTSSLDKSSITTQAVNQERKNVSYSLTKLSWRRSASSIFAEEFPPRDVTMRLFDVYKEIVHIRLPVVSLAIVQQHFALLYEHGQLDAVPPASRAMLLAVLACAIQASKLIGDHMPHYEPDQYIEMAISGLDQSWSEQMTLDHARLAVLLADYFYEADLCVASEIWAKTAQIIEHQCSSGGAHSKDRTQQVLDSAIAWTSIKTARANGANMQETFAGMHTLLQDQRRTGNEDPSDEHTALGLGNLDVIQALLQNAQKAFDGHGHADALHSFQLNIRMIIGTAPATFDARSPANLAPTGIFQAFAVQDIRMLVALQSSDQLRAALDVAEDTARLMMRSKRRPTWQQDLCRYSTAGLCLHLLRCAEILSLHAVFDAASVLVEASVAIGDKQAVNTRCGKTLAFFLSQLIACVVAQVVPATSEAMLSCLSAGTKRHHEHGRAESPHARHGSLDSVGTADAKDDALAEDEWTLVELRLARASEMVKASQSDHPETVPAQSSRARMHLSNILK